MKVAFLLCSETIGGHEFQSIEFALSSKKYCEPTVILNIPEHKRLVVNREIEFVLSENKFFENGNFIKQYYLSIKEKKHLRLLLKGYDIIVVCAGTLEAGISSSYALNNECCVYLYVPMFVDRKELWGKVGIIYNSLLRCFIRPYKKIITITEAQGRIFAKYKQVIILPNKIPSLDKSIPQKKRNKYRRLYFVGRLDNKQKRISELINWLDSPDNLIREFVIVGDGDAKVDILKQIEKLKYISVVLKGWMSLEEQNREFSSNDIFVINSAYEGEPLVIREANNRGSIVIARDIIGHYSCTYPENRYNDKKTLLSLIARANNGEINQYLNQTLDEIETLRKEALERLYL